MKEIGEGVHQFDGPGWWSNAYLVEADEPVVVDTGTPGGGPRIAEELRRAGVKPALILLTHSHYDHAGGAAALREATGAPICAAAAELPLLAGEAKHRLLARVGARAANLGRPVRMPSIDRRLEPGEVVAGLEVVATPGHTPGHVSFLRGRTILAGDAFMTGLVFREAVPFFVADRRAARLSIEKLAKLDLDLAVSGHGPPTRNASEKLGILAESWN